MSGVPINILSNYSPLQSGVSIFGGHNANSIIVDADFKAAKNNEQGRASELIARIIKPEHLQKIVELMPHDKDTVFVTVPGTTMRNRIPATMARFVSNGICRQCRIHTKYEISDYGGNVTSLHTQQAKCIPTKEGRLFSPRVFKVSNPDFLRRLEDKSVIVVEDILSTGDSANSFIRTLQKSGMDVNTVIVIQGIPDISPSKSDIDKLIIAAGVVGLSDINWEKLAIELPRSAVVGLWTGHLVHYAKAPVKEQQLLKKMYKLLYDYKVDGKMYAIDKLNENIIKLNAMRKRCVSR